MPDSADSLLCFLCLFYRHASECDVFDDTGHVACGQCMSDWTNDIECDGGDEPDPLPFEYEYEPNELEPANDCTVETLYAANDNNTESDKVA